MHFPMNYHFNTSVHVTKIQILLSITNGQVVHCDGYINTFQSRYNFFKFAFFRRVIFKTDLMPGTRFDFHATVEPGYLGQGFGFNATLEYKPFAIVFLPDGGFARERWRFTVHLSENDQ